MKIFDYMEQRIKIKMKNEEQSFIILFVSTFYFISLFDASNYSGWKEEINDNNIIFNKIIFIYDKKIQFNFYC